MSKKFVITKPRQGRSTVSLVTHVYRPQTLRTRTVYLGSFSLHLDPDSIPEMTLSPASAAHGISLRPVACDVADFGLTVADVALIRDWLRKNGTHAQRVAAAEDKRLALERSRVENEERLRREVEVDLRARLEASWHADFERRSRPPSDPLEAAVKALEAASVAVQESAAALSARGTRLTHQRSTRLSVSSTANALDRLQAQCNRVRLEAVARFEEACKAAGVMARRSMGK